jgi:L-ribulose-5-phosphate 3-epimerase
MKRRTFLHTAVAAAASGAALTPDSSKAASNVRIRKSLKWGMVKETKGTLAERFGKLKRCGFAGVEPNISAVKDPAEWLAASKETGLLIDCVVSAGTDGIETAVDVCKQLGGDSILVVARLEKDKSFWSNWKETQAAIKAAAPHAEKQQIKVLIENVWASFLVSPLDMLRYVDEIAHPWVGVHYDVGNIMRWGVAEHGIEVLGKRIGKLDIKEYSLDKAMKEGMSKGFDVPIGNGSINWPGVRAELARIEFTGWAAAEVKSGDWGYLAEVAQRMDNVLGLA